MADQASFNCDLNILKRSLAASADARAIVQDTRKLIEASHRALRESEVRVERTLEGNRWFDWMADIEPERLPSHDSRPTPNGMAT